MPFDIVKEFGCDGVPPSGPVCAWPKERNEALLAEQQERAKAYEARDKAMPSAPQMAKNLVRTASQAIRNGRVSKQIRDERFMTCRTCPAFDAASKRCRQCGCFMEAKTWIAGNKDALCPLKKWKR